MSNFLQPFKRISQSIGGAISRWIIALEMVCYRSTRYFYWLLATILTTVIIFAGLLQADFASMDEETFDTIMEMRWSSPKSSSDIVILDIDERSLAVLAPDYGRWPWPRDIYAQVLAELEYVEAKSIIFTVLITDPDRDHPRGDNTLDFVASESFVTVYPIVRLSPANDGYSKLKICDLPAAGIIKCSTDKTVAAILPALPGMHHDLAIMNHQSDEDGVLRRWGLFWEEESWKMPTVIGGAIALAHIEPKVDADESYVLNWRDEENGHLRFSFSDYLAALNGEGDISPDFFKDKHVIIGASAPGLSAMILTPTGVMNSGEVIATALNDAIYGTDLKTVPDELTLLASIIFIWVLAGLFSFGRSQKNLDGAFILLEISTVLIMVLAVNYAAYFIDTVPLATYGLVFYSIARLHYEMAESIFKGKTDYLLHISKNRGLDSVGIITFRDDQDKLLPGRRELLSLRKEVGGEVFYCNRPFRDDQVLEDINDVCGMIVVAERESQEGILKKLLDRLTDRGLQEHTSHIYDFPDKVRGNRRLIPKYIGMKTLDAMGDFPVDGM